IWYVGLLLFIIGLSTLCSLSLLIQYILEITNPIETPLHYVVNNNNRLSGISIDSSTHFDSVKVYRQVIIQNLCCSLVLLFCGIFTIICEFRLDLYNPPPPGLVTTAFAFSALQGTLISIIYFIDPAVNLCLKKFRKYLRKVYIDEYSLPEKGNRNKYDNDYHHDIIHANSMAGLPSTSMYSTTYGFRGGYNIGRFDNSLNLQKKINPYRWPWLAQTLHFILSHIFCMKPRRHQHHQRESTTYNMAHTITPTPTSLYTFNHRDVTPIHHSNHLNARSTNSIHSHPNDNDSNNYRKSAYSSKSTGTPIIKNIDSILPPLNFGDDSPLEPMVLNASHTCDNSDNNNDSGNSSDNDNSNRDSNKGKNKLKTPIPSPPLDLLNLYDDNAFPSSSSLLPPDQHSDFYNLSILTDSSSSLNENENNNSSNNNNNNNNTSVDSFNIGYPKNGSNRVYSSSLRNSGNLSITSLPPIYPQNSNEGSVDDFKKSFLHRILHHYQTQHQPQPKANNDSSISINSVASSPTMPHYRYHHHHHHQQLYSPSSLPSSLPPQPSSCTSSSHERVSFLQSPPLRRIKSPSILGRKHSSSSTLSFHSHETTTDRISTILSNRASSIITGSMDDYYKGLNVPTFQCYQQQLQQKEENKKLPENNHLDHFFKRKKKRKSNDKANISNNKLLKLSTNGPQFSYTFTTASQRHSRDSVILSPTTIKSLMSYGDPSYRNDEDLYIAEKDGLIYGWSMIIHIKNEQFDWNSTTLDEQQQKKEGDGDHNRIFTLLEYWNRNYAGSRWFVVE
ncbi:hypothetical protein BJ944DRAFT_273612, partial [Cunninghamella echinulata]